MPSTIETLFNSATRKRFYCPTRLVWGAGCREMVFELLEDAGTVMLFVDRFFADHPFVESLRERLGARLLSTHICSNMPRSQDLVAIAETVSTVPDAVVSIGGGSTVDAAKAVVGHWIFGTFDGVGMGDKRGLPRLPGARRPLLIGMPTTAGTGADVSRYYVTYDAEHRGKVHGKSFELLVDWALVDSVFLRGAPDDLMVISAFDAFVHFFESFICRFERSWFGDMLSLDGISRIIPALGAFLDGDRSDDTLLAMNYAASLGGMAISNVRTGNVHEAAGALLELTPLTHAETLFVFFEPAYRQYRRAIEDRETLLVRHMAAHAPQAKVGEFSDIIAWWTKAFEQLGLTERIKSAMRGVSDKAAARAHIFDRVIKDRVWCEKESPIALDEHAVRAFLDDSLDPYWT